MADELQVVPVTPERRADLAELFGPSGAYSNCWCTYFRYSAAGFDAASPAERRALLVGEIDAGREPGLLAYLDDRPVGWCSVAPRLEFARMMNRRSRVYAPLDDEPAWVINCFFVRRDARGRGVATALLHAAVDWAIARGASIVEGYPVEPGDHRPDAGVYTGTLSMFAEAGFEEVARRGGRPVVRRFGARSAEVRF